MQKGVYYIFVLILVFLVLAYYKGFSSDISSGGGVIYNIILGLQGRNKSNGAVANYPK